MTTAPVHVPAGAFPRSARRFVVLGASNVNRGFSSLVETIGHTWGRPLDILAAFGSGRSYGLPARLLWRTLPGIGTCGLWEALERRPAAPTAALLTDVGNDILYGVSVPEIAGWVEECVDRLQRIGARIVLTPLPLCSVARLSPARFQMLRNILFPGRRPSYAAIMERVNDLDRHLRTLAQQRGLLLAEPQAQWYGFDAIHVRYRHFPTAWRTILGPLREETTPPEGNVLSCPWFHRLRWAPEQRWVFGKDRHTAQPVARWADGSTLALY